MIESIDDFRVLVVDPGDGERIQAALGACFYLNWHGDVWNICDAPVLLSGRAGSWRGISDRMVTLTIAMDPAMSSLVYAGGFKGLQRSLDGGETWASIPEFKETTVSNIVVVP